MGDSRYTELTNRLMNTREMVQNAYDNYGYDGHNLNSGELHELIEVLDDTIARFKRTEDFLKMVRKDHSRRIRIKKAKELHDLGKTNDEIAKELEMKENFEIHHLIDQGSLVEDSDEIL